MDPEPIQPAPIAPTPVAELHPLEVAASQRKTLLRIVRLTCVVLFVTVTLLAVLDIDPGSGTGSVIFGGLALKLGWDAVLILAAALASGVVIVDVLTTRRKIGTLITIFVGLLVALLGTYALGRVLDLLVDLYDIPTGASGMIATVKVLLGIGLAYLSITTVLTTQDDFRLVIPYVEFAKQSRGARPHVLDTSVLIDARIADLAQTGIMQYPLVIPYFVVGELQALADSQDRLKRGRGRRGLDVVARLQRTPGVDISIDETPVPGKAVDQMLIELARQMEAVVVSADTGLARVAAIQGVRVLNLNDVANSLKPALVPGEQLALRLIKPGEQPHQAVGYLDDGTMVVAENGRQWIGEMVTLNVTSTLQTSAGRMIFGRVPETTREAAERDEVPAALAEPAPPKATGIDMTAASSAPEAQGSKAAPAEPQLNGPSPIESQAIDAGTIEQQPKRGPFPPKPPNKRANPFRNPRR
ncbi:MAG: PIN/TRAM domain-containing protein [Phycisphaerales bacterium]